MDVIHAFRKSTPTPDHLSTIFYTNDDTLRSVYLPGMTAASVGVYIQQQMPFEWWYICCHQRQRRSHQSTTTTGAAVWSINGCAADDWSKWAMQRDVIVSVPPPPPTRHPLASSQSRWAQRRRWLLVITIQSTVAVILRHPATKAEKFLILVARVSYPSIFQSLSLKTDFQTIKSDALCGIR